MSAKLIVAPKFDLDEIVCFAGGVGRIKSYQSDAKTWTYTVEMEMGSEPEFGRIGSETTILLQEADIQRIWQGAKWN